MLRENFLAMALAPVPIGPVFAQNSGQNDPIPESTIQHCIRSLARATKRAVRATRHATRYSATITTHLKEASREVAAQ